MSLGKEKSLYVPSALARDQAGGCFIKNTIITDSSLTAATADSHGM